MTTTKEDQMGYPFGPGDIVHLMHEDTGEEYDLAGQDLEPGFYVVNPRGAPGGWWHGPHPTPEDALGYWRESGVYAGEQIVYIAADPDSSWPDGEATDA